MTVESSNPHWYYLLFLSISVGLIVGGVIAGIAVLCIIVALVCCCVKKQGHAGRVVGPHPQRGPGANVTVVHAGTNTVNVTSRLCTPVRSRGSTAKVVKQTGTSRTGLGSLPVYNCRFGKHRCASLKFIPILHVLQKILDAAVS